MNIFRINKGVISTVFAIIALLLSLGSVWWWAILGLDEDIGWAIGFTIGILGFISLFYWITSDA